MLLATLETFSTLQFSSMILLLHHRQEIIGQAHVGAEGGGE